MRLRSLYLLAIALVLTALPAQAATYQTFVLSNEGTNGFITQLLAEGYGSYNLYQALLAIQNNTDPSVEGIITDTFLLALASQPPSSAIFTTRLTGFAATGQGVAISTDGTVKVVSIFGASYQGKSGVSTLDSDISGVGHAKFLSGGTITSFSVGGNTYNVLGIAFSGEQTFVLSNEGTNGLITQLVAGGYGKFNLYQTLVTIQGDTDPSVAGIITDAFLGGELEYLPASSAIFATPLKNFSLGSQGLAISTDGTVQVVNISGRSYYDDGAPALSAEISGVGRGLFTFSSSTGSYLTSFTSGGTTYNVFAIGWMAGPAPRISLAGIGNAANYVAGKVSPGEIVVVYGEDFGPPTLAQLQFVDGAATTTLGNTRIYFGLCAGI